MSEKRIGIDFSDMSGGKNSAFPQHALADNQVRDTINAVHEPLGCSRAPGYMGITTTALFAAAITGQFTYRTSTGTEYMICVSDGKVYSVSLSLNTKTEIGTMTGAGKCYAVNASGKLWIVNGTSFVKVESDLAVYRVGIATPTGTSAAKLAGGTLADGVYGCYYSYARKDAAGRYLYSLPYSLGDVTLGAGDNTVRFTVPASADGQVTHKVFWMTDAGGTVPYYYGEVINATTPYDITSAAARNSAIRMDVNASSNQVLPIAPTGIALFDDRLIVWIDYTIYWSLKTDVNPLNMERFVAENFRTFSVVVSSIFTVDVDLFINSVKDGIFKLPFGDFTAVLKNINRRLWFNPATTEEGKNYVVYHNKLAFGYTNDGIRFFNGEMFSDDLTYHIKPDIDKVTLGVSSAYIPAMVVYRREGKRTELRFSYRDTSLSTTMNNTQLVFNLDTFFDPNYSKRCWEVWETGFYSYTIVDENIYFAQVKTNSVIAKEAGVTDIYVYNKAAAFLSVKTTKQIYILTRTYLKKLDVLNIWGKVYLLATASNEVSGNYILFDNGNTKYPFTFTGQPGGLAILPADGSGGLVLPIVLVGEFPVSSSQKVPLNASSNSLAIEISQNADDPNFKLYSIQLPKVSEIINNLT